MSDSIRESGPPISAASGNQLKNTTSTPTQTPAAAPSGTAAASQYFAHPHALVEAGVTIGAGTRIWAFAHVATGATLGTDCNICDHTFIEGGVRIGHRVTLKCGVYLWNGITLEDDVFIGPAAVFTNDNRPRIKKHLNSDLKTVLQQGCTIGANSTIHPNLTIGRWAMVGAGAVVTHSVLDYSLVLGNPACWQAWVCQCGEKLIPRSGPFLDCTCGRAFEKLEDNGLREVAPNGGPQQQATTGITAKGHAASLDY